MDMNKENIENTQSNVHAASIVSKKKVAILVGGLPNNEQASGQHLPQTMRPANPLQE